MLHSFIMTDTIQNVHAEISALEEGQEARFPIARYDYVVSARYRIALKTKRTLTSKIEGDEVVITREDKAQ